jgi:tRNA U54 and U55 pseudouridine synthase Pus10
MNLPGDFIARLVEAQKKKYNNDDGNDTNLPSNMATDFAQDLKLHAKTLLDDCLNRLESGNNNSSNANDDDEYPPCVKEEEQGHLSIYAIVLPARHISRPSCVAKNERSKKSRKRRHQQQQQSGGNQDSLVQQGGDPYLNLENIVQAAHDNAVIWTMNQALNSMSSDGNGDDCDDDDDFFDKPIHTTMLNKSNGENGCGSNNDMNDHDNAATPALDIYVAVWRRPFYLQSMYTKTRRDVSQTPFYVVDSVNVDDTDGQSINDDDINVESTATTTTKTTAQTSNKRSKTQRVRRKLGVTSVEEEILPTITKYAGGISTLNNAHDGTSVNSNNMTIQFGMAKFHASGREDMDVRMLLPSAEHTNNANDTITGRPFVCEVIDAYQLPPMSSLSLIENEINHTTTTTTAALPLQGAVKDSDDESAMIRTYGKNPMGVGIAPCLNFVPSSSFKNLQAMTESKVKYYCCLCWSEKPLSSFWENTNGKEAATLNEILGSFPTEIQQRTPLRVLHRRPNIIRLRHVLSCSAMPIDEHHFRLHLSTDAGTCKYRTTYTVNP